jgi:uncharacterized protein (DUF2225 family)
MKKTYFILLVSISLLKFSITYACLHTCTNETVKCPIDGTKVKFCVTMSMTTFGSHKDFQMQGAVGDHYEQLINSCPKCKFSGYLDDFNEKYTEEEKNKISEFLSIYKEIKITEAEECLIAGEIKSLINKKNSEIAFCFLNGSYLLRYSKNDINQRKDLQIKAIDKLKLALQNNEYEDVSMIANINYLVGEMFRRTGKFDDAILYYDKAISDKNKEEWVESVAIKQKELAIKKDDNNEI